MWNWLMLAANSATLTEHGTLRVDVGEPLDTRCIGMKYGAPKWGSMERSFPSFNHIQFSKENLTHNEAFEMISHSDRGVTWASVGGISVLDQTRRISLFLVS